MPQAIREQAALFRIFLTFNVGRGKKTPLIFASFSSTNVLKKGILNLKLSAEFSNYFNGNLDRVFKQANTC